MLADCLTLHVYDDSADPVKVQTSVLDVTHGATVERKIPFACRPILY